MFYINILHYETYRFWSEEFLTAEQNFWIKIEMIFLYNFSEQNSNRSIRSNNSWILSTNSCYHRTTSSRKFRRENNRFLKELSSNIQTTSDNYFKEKLFDQNASLQVFWAKICGEDWRHHFNYFSHSSFLDREEMFLFILKNYCRREIFALTKYFKREKSFD